MSGNTATACDRLTGAAIACELFEVLRGQWLDRRQIRDALSLSHGCVERWTNEFVEQGSMLVERKRPARGNPAREFTLSAEWGGRA